MTIEEWFQRCLEQLKEQIKHCETLEQKHPALHRGYLECLQSQLGWAQAAVEVKLQTLS